MTDTYKQELLKYITGKVDIQTGTNEPIFNTQAENISNNLKEDITDLLITQESATTVSIYGKIYNENYENFVVYGIYIKSSKYYGYICIVDKSLNIVSLLTEFTSGTKIYPFIAMQEDESGNLFALTDDYNASHTEVRVCLFNNVLASGIINNQYKVRLRQTYFVPNASDYRHSPARQNRIIKIPDEATYYITFHNTSNQTLIIRFTIVVGGTNEWEVFTLGQQLDNVNFSIVPTKSGDNNIIYFYGIDVISSSSSIFKVYQITDSATEIYSYNFNVNVSWSASQVYSVSTNKAYISLYDLTNVKITLYLYESGSITKLWEQSVSSSTNGGYLYLESKNNIMFLKLKDYGDTNTITSVGILQDNQVYLYQALTYPTVVPTILDYVDFYIMVMFNLITMYIPNYQTTPNTKKLDFVYNPLNYNGNAYTNINELVPKSTILYNDNDKLVFARNIYNKVINGNTTVASVEILNNLLNDETIYTEQLYGETKQQLIANQETIEKNIYETVDINFYNTLIMKDNNDINNPIINNVGATRINNSVSNLVDYQESQGTSARINYVDGTTHIITIDPTTQITITNGVATYQFIIYVDKAINNIEMVSNDNNTSYATINGTFTIGKYYKITQDVYVV